MSPDQKTNSLETVTITIPIEDLQDYLADPSEKKKDKLVKVMAGISRWDLLPILFQIRGEPYTLVDYPQFETFYSKNYARDTIWMCGRQVSKSTNLSRSEILDAVQIPFFQILYVAPLQSQAQRYSALYLRESITTCKPALMLQEKPRTEAGGVDAPLVKSVMHQTFANGAGVQMTYAKTSSDRARGITADRIDFDEIQDQLTDHVPVISESLSNSRWAVRRFTGTAKTTDNTIEHLWRQSAMSEWSVKCEGCNHWNIPTREGGVLDMIAAIGPVCCKCGKRLNVRNGHWIHAYPDRVDEFQGYHIPQLMLPAITEDQLKWGAFINKVTKLPPSIIYTELLGISSDEGVRLITQDDIDTASILGTHAELKKKYKNYAYIVLGVDWGIAEITSFTVATVVGINHNGEMHVLYGKRYVGQAMEATIDDITRMSRAFHVDFISADFGVGFTNNQMLAARNQHVIQIQYVQQNKFLSFKEGQGVPRWSVDRNTALTVLFWNIKNKYVFFPDKDESHTYTRDLLSPYEELIEASSGITKKRFMRDPARPDDFAHALCFAMMVLFQLTGHKLLRVVPEEMLPHGFDFEAPVDVDAIMQTQGNL